MSLGRVFPLPANGVQGAAGGGDEKRWADAILRRKQGHELHHSRRDAPSVAVRADDERERTEDEGFTTRDGSE